MFAEQLDLLAAIYDATIDPSLWDETIDRIRRALGFEMAILGLNTFDGTVSIQSTSNVPEPYLKLINRYGEAAMGLWGGPGGIAAVPLEQPVLMSQFSAPSSWVGNRYFEEWARPQKLVDQVAIKLEFDAAHLSSFSLGVSEGMVSTAKRQLRSLQILAPHLRRAAILTGMLEAKRTRIDALDATLSTLRSAAFVVDDRMNVLISNQRGDAMFEAGDPVSLRDDRLHLAGELIDGSVAHALQQAMIDSLGLRSGSGVPIRSKVHGDFLVHILPLERRSGPKGAVACLFVTRTSQELDLPLDTAQVLHDLSPAETRVLALLLNGCTGKEIASRLSIAPSTVKSHCQHIFDKVGVSSRVELATAVFSLTTSLRKR